MKSYFATAAILAAVAAGPAIGQTAGTMEPAGTAPMTSAAYAAPEGYTLRTDWTGITAEQITGSDVIGPDGATIGSVSDVVLGADGMMSAIILDVGGFLGMGAHTVSLGSDQVSLYTNADGDVVAHSTLSKDALEALPEYTPPA